MKASKLKVGDRVIHPAGEKEISNLSKGPWVGSIKIEYSDGNCSYLGKDVEIEVK